MLNAFDHSIITAVNQFAQHFPRFDRIVNFLSGVHLLKGGVLVTGLWWAWFHKSRVPGRDPRQHILITVLCTVVAIGVGRLLQLALPFRPRPMHSPDLAFNLPTGALPTLMRDWSSFPSDHAVMFFALATGLWFVARRAALLGWLFALVFICLPRLYLGLHYPTDLLAGAAVGVIIALAGNQLLAGSKPVTRLIAMSERQPQFFYPAFFVASFQLAVMFDDVRAVLGAASKFVHIAAL